MQLIGGAAVEFEVPGASGDISFGLLYRFAGIATSSSANSAWRSRMRADSLARIGPRSKAVHALP